MSDATFRTERVIPHTAEQIFTAFTRPELLARWWGPDGFTNTFELHEFKTGGQWKYVMHGPNGANFKNESVFVEVTPSSRIVIQHVSKPRYLLTIALTKHERGTTVSWNQEFEDSAVAARVKHIVEPANEQNLDRLQAVLAG